MGKGLADRGPGAEEGHVQIREGLRSGFPNSVSRPAVTDFLARGALRGQKGDRFRRIRPLMEKPEQLLANGTGGANYADFLSHL